MLIPCDEVKIILRLLLLLTNLHLKLLSTQGTGADKLLSTQRVKTRVEKSNVKVNKVLLINLLIHTLALMISVTYKRDKAVH